MPRDAEVRCRPPCDAVHLYANTKALKPPLLGEALLADEYLCHRFHLPAGSEDLEVGARVIYRASAEPDPELHVESGL